MVALKKLLLIANITLLLSLACGLMVSLSYADNSASLIPTRMVISSINLDTSIVPTGYEIIEINGQYYTKWLVDNNLVGWQNPSAPIGQPGNTILNGHSDIGGMVFQNLPLVQVGHVITVYVGIQPYTYLISQTVIVQEKGVSLEQRIANAQWMAATPDERLTLITCLYPGATHRLIVIATLMREANVIWSNHPNQADLKGSNPEPLRSKDNVTDRP